MRITVVGTGYVGLVAGACFSDSGNHVVCFDVDQEKISKLQRCVIPIFEPGLEELVERNTKAKRLTFSSDPVESLKKAQIVFIAVGTPSGEDGSLDLRYVLAAAKLVKENIQNEILLVLKSTVPVGAADLVREAVHGCPHPISVVSNPEFLKEGTAVNDFLRPERVVIGCASEKAQQVMNDLYSPFIRSGNPIYFMDNRSAELAKYAANAFLAMKISFINNLANLSENVGANIHDVRRAIVSDSRIGNKFLYPGCGYGGSCFPKDVLGLIHLGKQYSMPLDLFTAVHETNEKQKRVLFEKIQKHFKSNLSGKTVTLWGLSFKPMTDDMREAPSVRLITELLDAGCSVNAYDPVASHEARRTFGEKITLFDDAYEAVQGADALAILTEWNEFRSPDFELLKKSLKTPTIFDGRNVYNPESLESQGFYYYCIGRPDPVVKAKRTSAQPETAVVGYGVETSQ